MLSRLDQLAAAIDEHAANIERFQKGELSADAFRPLRLAMGVYAQLAHVKHMQRIKISGGQITAAQLHALGEATERWGRGLAHVTTRQDIQLHYLDLDDTVACQRFLLESGITTVGACADTVRNVTASHLAGVVEEEVFDVTPYAHAITQHFFFHEHNRKLPRKFKIGLSGSDRDIAQAMINDIGLFARVENKKRGFQFFLAGGLGSTPEIAHLWKSFIPEEELFAACDAVVSVFFRDGERKNRKKNRLKFLLRKIGESEFFRRVDEEFDRIRQQSGVALSQELQQHLSTYVESEAPPQETNGVALGDAAFVRWKRTNTVAQKQKGYSVVTIKLALGDITAEQMKSVAALCSQYGNGEVRATNAQNLVMRWVPEGKLVALHRELGLVGLAEPDAGHITDVVSCPGGDYCSLAITKSMGVAARIREHLLPQGHRTETDDIISKIGLFDIKISGCPNSCGQHHVADIGMTGIMAKDKDGNEKPHYSLRIGGGCGVSARVGDRMDGRVPEEETPKVIAALAQYYLDQRQPDESFREFSIRKGIDELTRVGFAAANNVI